MLVYFNNCRRRDHLRIYGEDAFYDLNTGPHAHLVRNLDVGQECIVATPRKGGTVEFGWFSFSHEAVKLDDTKTPCRVFFGRFIKSETYPKAVAAKTEAYAPFFNIVGNFKRQSVIVRER